MNWKNRFIKLLERMNEANNLRSDSEFYYNGIWNSLDSAYSQLWRKYHNWEHIHCCLHSLDLVIEEANLKNTDSLELAIWFHDAIYHLNNPEKDSTKVASYILTPSSSIYVSNLIMATKHDVLVKNKDCQLIADIDLFSLSLMYEDFIDNSRKIKEEYIALGVLPEVFDVKRKEFLKKFLERPYIYQTTYFKRFEQQARENLIRASS